MLAVGLRTALGFSEVKLTFVARNFAHLTYLLFLALEGESV